MGLQVQHIFAKSEARTATETFEVESNGSCQGHFIVDITAGATGTDTLTITIDAQDPASGKWYNLLSSAALVAVGTTVLKVGTDFTAVANEVVEDFLPKKFRIVATKNNATPITYSIGGNLK